jgi:putative spermidine/putrescine transport system permease protein
VKFRGRRIDIAASGAGLLPFLLLQLLVIWIPLGLFLSYAFAGGGQAWADLLTSPGKLASIRRTLAIAAETTLLTAVLGYVYAGALRIVGHWGRILLTIAVVVPFLTSIVVRTYAWLIVLGNDGPINAALRWAFGPAAELPLLFNRAGVLIGMVHVLLPMFILPLYAVWSQQPANLARAARSLGAGRVQTFFSVDLPLSLPGAAAGATLVFTQALGFFVTPAALGGLGDTMVAQFIDSEMTRFANLGAAAALAVVLAAAVALCIGAFRSLYPLELLFVQPAALAELGTRESAVARFMRRSLAAAGAAIAKYLSLAFDHLPWGLISKTIASLIALYFVLPLAIVLPVSFIGESYLHFPPDTYGLGWYRGVIGDPQWRAAAGHSVITGAIACLVAWIVGLPVAFALVRGRFSARLKGITIALLILPTIVPVIVLSVGVYVWFLDLHLIARLWALGIAHALLGLPFMTLIVMTALRDFDRRIEQAARSLGATAFAALRSITLPILKGALIAGTLLTFLHSFDELLIARAVTNFDTVTLPVKLWNGAVEEISPALAVVSTVSLALALIVASTTIALSVKREARR